MRLSVHLLCRLPTLPDLEDLYDDAYLAQTLDMAFGDSETFQVPVGVSRYDYGRTHGWWVRVSRDGVLFRKMFYDSKEGSPQESLKAAIRHRHNILASLPSDTKFVHSKALSSDPATRVGRYEEAGKKQRYEYWKARWYDKDHKIRTKNFSVKRYGEEGAKQLALAAAEQNHNRKPKLTKAPDPYRSRKLKPTSRSDIEVLSKINDSYSRSGTSDSVAPVSEDPFAFEGERKMALHQRIERDRAFRDRKVKEFIDENGSVHCEVCKFSFAESYPFLESDIIEVHHIVPLGSLSKSTKVRMYDLMLLCSNCHFAIHQGDAEDNLILALDHFGS